MKKGLAISLGLLIGIALGCVDIYVLTEVFGLTRIQTLSVSSYYVIQALVFFSLLLLAIKLIGSKEENQLHEELESDSDEKIL